MGLEPEIRPLSSKTMQGGTHSDLISYFLLKHACWKTGGEMLFCSAKKIGSCYQDVPVQSGSDSGV